MKQPNNRPIKVMLVEDHQLLRMGLANLINASNTGFLVTEQADNGRQMVEKITALAPDDRPDLVLLDVNMPQMDGYEAAAWLKKHHPKIKSLALTMTDDHQTLMRMFRNGATGYLLKSIGPDELITALKASYDKGFYDSEYVARKMREGIVKNEVGSESGSVHLSPREIEFLQLVCTDLSYKEISEKMFLSPRTVDGLRDSLFEKFGVNSRVGVILFCLRNGLVQLER